MNRIEIENENRNQIVKYLTALDSEINTHERDYILALGIDSEIVVKHRQDVIEFAKTIRKVNLYKDILTKADIIRKKQKAAQSMLDLNDVVSTISQKNENIAVHDRYIATITYETNNIEELRHKISKL